MKQYSGKIILVIAFVTLIAAFFAFDLGRYLQLEYLKSSQAGIAEWRNANPFKAALAFLAAYIAVTGFSLPGALILTLAGGAIFGFVQGSILVSLASTIGATIAFLASRYLFREPVQKKFGEKLSAINEGVEKDGPFYLFTLRLIPIFPFFIVNLVMGLTPIKTLIYSLVSWAGMLPGTLVYVNIGTQLAKIDSLKGLLSPTLIGSFVLIGILPIASKKFVEYLRRKK